MALDAINFRSGISFKENTETKTDKVTDNIKSDYEKTPAEDTFIKDEESDLLQDNKTVEKAEQEKTAATPEKKKHFIRNIIVGAVALPVLFYGGLVLKHKLSKPTFDEIHKCLKEIFNKDLTKDEVNSLLDKYKKLLKNDNTEDFAKQMIEQLKKDYGIENIKTQVNVELLKDGKLKTALEHTTLGEASPVGDINILPRTNSQIVARGHQKEIFGTGFHELKHMQQFAEAYRANPDKFAEVLYTRNIKPEEIEKTTKEEVKRIEDEIMTKAKGLKNGDDKIYEEIIKLNPDLRKFSKNEIKNEFKKLSLDAIIKSIKKSKGYNTDEEMYNLIKKDVENNTKDAYRKLLDNRYSGLTRYEEGSEEYKKGMEYIEAYEKYPHDPQKDYDVYRANLLEKEAWDNEGLSEKIYNYLKSIWSI